MTNAIKLFRGGFGHVSILNVANSLVTHAHEEVHIIIWLAGASGEMTVGSERVQPGQRVAVGINTLTPHRHDFPAECEGVFLAFYIDPDWIARRGGVESGESLFGRSAISIDQRVNDLAMRLLENLTGDAVPTRAVEGKIEGFIECIAKSALSQRWDRRASTGYAGAPDHRVRKAATLMKSHVNERECLEKVARSVGLSRPHFFALFKEQMGLTPNVYWNSMRMAEAARQLRASDEPLIDIANGLGFSTQGNFSRFFRDHFGVPPTLYRSAARQLQQ